MLQTHITIDTTSRTNSGLQLLPPLSLQEAAKRAHLYALTGVPIEAQGSMRLSQALVFARQHALRRPSRADVQAAFERSTTMRLE